MAKAAFFTSLRTALFFLLVEKNGTFSVLVKVGVAEFCSGSVLHP